MPGTIIKVKWPIGKALITDKNGSAIYVNSADPNDHYRADLEKNVGKQGRDWNWKIGPIAADNGYGTSGHDSLYIKMRKGRDTYASFAKLKWM